MTTRTINIALVEQTSQQRRLEFTPDDVASLGGELLLENVYVTTTNDSGVGSIVLPCKPSGSILWHWQILGFEEGPSTGSFYLAAGGAVDFDALADAGGAASDSVVDYIDGQLAALDATLVHVTGDEEIAGVKTFDASPIVPAPTEDLQAATKKYVDDNAAVGVTTLMGMIGETELLPRDADYFGLWPNGWLDESTGGTNAPRTYNDRPSSGTANDGYTVFESTGGTNLLQLTSPPFNLNSNKNLFFVLDSKTFSGTPSINAYLQGYHGGGDDGTAQVQILDSYNPGGGWDRKGIRINANGGSSPAIPATSDRAVIHLVLATNNDVKIGIKAVYVGHEETYHTDQMAAASGGHEAYYDGTNVFISVFFSGFIAKMTAAGVYVVGLGSGGGVDPHQITGQGAYLYCAEWGSQRITKRIKTAHAGSSPAGSVATTSQPFSVCILGGYLWASTVDKTLYKIDLSTFTLAASYTITAQNNSSTECTLLAVGGYLWMHTTVDGKVLKIDPATGSVVATINPPSAFGTSVQNYGFGSLGTKLYLAFHNGTLVEYDTATVAITNTWNIGVTSSGQIKSDGTALWFVGATPNPHLTRFDPATGVFHRMPLRYAHGVKWCEVVGDQVWAGGLDSGRIQRFARF